MRIDLVVVIGDLVFFWGFGPAWIVISGPPSGILGYPLTTKHPPPLLAPPGRHTGVLSGFST